MNGKLTAILFPVLLLWGGMSRPALSQLTPTQPIPASPNPAPTFPMQPVPPASSWSQRAQANERRIDQLARQLTETQAALRATQVQLDAYQHHQTMRPAHLTNQSLDAPAPPLVESDPALASPAYSPQEVDWHYCPDCGKSTCPGVSNLCEGCREDLSWNKGAFRIVPFGAVTGEMIGSNVSPQLRGSPLFLLPGPEPGISDSRFTTSAQQSTLGVNISGPTYGDFRSNAIVAVNFFGEQPVQNNPGLFFMVAHAGIQNDSWRFWAGQDADGIGRQNTNSPAWTSHKMQGNVGQIRPGFRVERYFRFSEGLGSSIYFGLTQQAVNDFIAVPGVAGIDNGWPNVELRGELTLGSDACGYRPVMLAIGGLVGETRAVDDAASLGSNVSTSWAVIPEVKIEFARWGFHGECFVGQAFGTYNGAIGQSLDPNDGDPIYSAGGFGELFWKVTPDFTFSVGYGIDDPRDADLGVIEDLVGQRSRNEAYWANIIWRLSDAWETRFEISHLETTYLAPSNDASSVLYHALVRYSF